MYWLLQVLVRYFWLPIGAMVVYEVYNNGSRYGLMSGVVVGVITLLIGLALWGMLYVALLLCTFVTSISRTIAEVHRMQQRFSPYRRSSSSVESESEGPIVEGSIITDLEQERKRRRRE
jgi:hypothetical protein